MDEKLHVISQEVSHYKQTMNILQDRLNTAEIERDRAIRDKDKAMSEVVERAKELEWKKHQITTELNSKLKKIEQLLHTLESEHQNAERVIADLKEQLDVAEQERDEAINLKDQALIKVAEAANEVQQREDQISNLKKHLQIKEEQILALNMQVYYDCAL